MSIIIIDGTKYDVNIVNHEISADVIDRYAERVESGDLKHEVLGVFHNFYLELGQITDPAYFNALYLDLTAPIAERRVTLPGRFRTYTFMCYIRVGKVKLLHERPGGNWYDNLKVDFIAISPDRRG